MMDFESFKEGGMTITIEQGRPTEAEELSFSVYIYGRAAKGEEDDFEQIFMPADVTCCQATALICRHFSELYKEEI